MKSLQKELTVNRCLLIQIIGQRKAFYRQKIPEPSCLNKKTVGIDILVTSRNGDRKITISQDNNRPPSRKRKGTS